MSIATRIALVAAISLAAACAAAAQESWVGKTIITKKAGIKIGHTGEDGRQILIAELKQVDYKVLGDKDGWLQVKDGRGNAGWFDKEDAVVLENAAAFFTERIRQNPNDGNAYYKRGVAWKLKNELDIAIKDFTDAVRLDPRERVFWQNRGNCWARKKEYDKAIADLNEAIRLDPQYLTAYSDRADVWRLTKEYDKAITDYTEMIRLDPKNGHAYESRAWIWATASDAKFRDGKKAVASARQALELAPKSAGVIDTLAAAYAESGDFVEAVRWQEKALADPRFRDNAAYRRRLELYRDKKPYHQD